MLLKCNTRIDVFDKEGRAALHLAAESGSMEGLTSLHFAANLVDYLVKKHGATIESLMIKKQTPMHLAALSGKMETVQNGEAQNLAVRCMGPLVGKVKDFEEKRDWEVSLGKVKNKEMNSEPNGSTTPGKHGMEATVLGIYATNWAPNTPLRTFAILTLVLLHKATLITASWVQEVEDS